MSAYDYAGGKQTDPFDGLDGDVKRGIDGITACLAGRRAEARQLLLLALCALYRGDQTSPSFEDTIPDPEFREELLGLLRILIDRIRDSERMLENLDYHIPEETKSTSSMNKSSMRRTPSSSFPVRGRLVLDLVKTKAHSFYGQYVSSQTTTAESNEAKRTSSPIQSKSTSREAPTQQEEEVTQLTITPTGICRSRLLLLQTRQLQSYIAETMKKEEEQQEDYDRTLASLAERQQQQSYEESTFDESVSWSRIAELGMPAADGDDSDSDSSLSVEETAVSPSRSYEEQCETADRVHDKDRQVLSHEIIAQLKKAQRRSQKKEKREKKEKKAALLKSGGDEEQKPTTVEENKIVVEKIPEKGKEKIRIATPKQQQQISNSKNNSKQPSLKASVTIPTSSNSGRGSHHQNRKGGKCPRERIWQQDKSSDPSNKPKPSKSDQKGPEAASVDQQKGPSNSNKKLPSSISGKGGNSVSSSDRSESKSSRRKQRSESKKQSVAVKSSKGDLKSSKIRVKSEEMAGELRRNRSCFVSANPANAQQPRK